MEKSNIRLMEIEQQPYSSGVRRIKAKYERPDGSIFWAFAVIGDAKETALITGTANGGYGIDDCVDVVPGQMQTALEEGHAVLAGMNAGYFRRKFHFVAVNHTLDFIKLDFDRIGSCLRNDILCCQHGHMSFTAHDIVLIKSFIK